MELFSLWDLLKKKTFRDIDFLHCMSLPSNAYINLATDLKICRILNGMWQVAGGHGSIDPNAAIEDMFTYHDFGLTTWDLADIYGPAEDFIGEFHRRIAIQRGGEEIKKIQAHTKFVPRPGRMSKQVVEQAIDVSRKKMLADSIDLVQFHWWDYSHNAYHDALVHLQSLKDEGKIRHIGLTNFDTDRMQIIKDWGIELVTNQIQYSIVDQRPSVKMEKFCTENNVLLLTYGTLCGGLISEKYLGAPEPTEDELDTLSLHKYKNMIDAWGGWELFQELLQVLQKIAHKHNASIANVATRFILDKPSVAGVIIGARLGISNHKEDNANVFSFRLDSDDYEKIKMITDKSSNLFSIIGDCGDEYR